MSKCQALALAVPVAGAVAAGLVFFVGYTLGRRQRTVKGSSKQAGKDEPYILELNSEDIVLRDLRLLSCQQKRGNMTTSVQSGKLLTFLCRNLNAKKVLDVGLFTGCSAYAMALGLPDDGKVIACDISQEYADIGIPYWERGGVAGKIDLRIAPAINTMRELVEHEEGTFDVVFVDADKPNYPNYYELGIKLLRKGGVFVVDNAMWNGRVVDQSNNEASTVAIRCLNELMSSDPQVEYMMLHFADGTGLAQKL